METPKNRTPKTEEMLLSTGAKVRKPAVPRAPQTGLDMFTVNESAKIDDSVRR